MCAICLSPLQHTKPAWTPSQLNKLRWMCSPQTDDPGPLSTNSRVTGIEEATIILLLESTRDSHQRLDFNWTQERLQPFFLKDRTFPRTVVTKTGHPGRDLYIPPSMVFLSWWLSLSYADKCAYTDKKTRDLQTTCATHSHCCSFSG